jgi:hypothetical protein
MSYEIRRYLELQQSLQRAINAFRDEQSHITQLREASKPLGMDSSIMASIQKEIDWHRKISSSLEGVGGITKFAQDIERQRKLLEGPLDEAKRLGLYDTRSEFHKLLDKTIEEQQSYERLFRSPTFSELSRFAREVQEMNSFSRTLLGNQGLQEAMAKMHSPWLQVENSLASAAAFSKIITMGHGIESQSAYDLNLTAALRSNLGDWRDLLTPSPEWLIDPVPRSLFYVERGFDPDLTDFTQSAFDECLQIAGLSETEEIEGTDDQEDGFARTNKAFNQLLRFEHEVRRFIERVMQAAFGANWMRQQLPPTMLESWIKKRDKAVQAGHAEQPLIDYADFSDYKAIIERKDNWKAVFKPVFIRPEDVRESFQRLFPVRIATMHARFITPSDELLLVVETKRVLRAIISPQNTV